MNTTLAEVIIMIIIIAIIIIIMILLIIVILLLIIIMIIMITVGFVSGTVGNLPISGIYSKSNCKISSPKSTCNQKLFRMQRPSYLKNSCDLEPRSGHRTIQSTSEETGDSGGAVDSHVTTATDRGAGKRFSIAGVRAVCVSQILASCWICDCTWCSLHLQS